MAVQVCYSLEDPETRGREISALIKLSGRLELKRWLIITRDEEEIIRDHGIHIEVIPVWRWLYEEEKILSISE